MRAPDPRQSARSIQARLFFRLTRAFGVTVFLTVLAVLGLVLWYLIRDSKHNPILRFQPLIVLETYYALNEYRWDGVERLFQLGADSPLEDYSPSWRSATLIDEEGRMLVDQGRLDTPRVGQVYTLLPTDLRMNLYAQDRVIGALVFTPENYPAPWRLAAAVLLPVALVSIPPAILALLVGLFLTRRVVVPLSEVMAAAQAVAAGNLAARVRVGGRDDVQMLSERFNQMAGALERSAHERREMLADVAHELRTPLTVIRGRLEGMLDGIYPPDEAHVAPVLEETYLLERLVEDLRLLTLAETRQIHLDPHPLNLADLALRAVGLFEAEAAEKHIDLGFSRPGLEGPGSLPAVEIDAQRSEQVIGNLLSNALRYVPAGGAVTVRLGAADGWVWLAVCDNGPGVAAADLPHLFDRFWRGEKSRSRSAGGAGLGLAIARQLVEAQGGEISACNRPGGGLEIKIRFRAVS